MVSELSLATEGTFARVADMKAGFDMEKRLKDMGILRDEQIKIIKNDTKGPVIINVKGAQIALGRGVAEKIVVEVSDGE